MDFHQLVHVFKTSEQAIKAHLDLLKVLPQHISSQQVTVADLKDSEAGEGAVAGQDGLRAMGMTAACIILVHGWQCAAGCAPCVVHAWHLPWSSMC